MSQANKSSRRLWSAVMVSAVLCGDVTSANDGALGGSYTLVAQANGATDAVIDAAIDASIASMNVIIRPVARARLRQNNIAYQHLRITQTATDIEIALGDLKPIQMPANGTAVKWISEGGEASSVSVHEEGSRLTQTFRSDDGMRVNSFHRDAQADVLYLDVSTSAQRLPRPVKYRLVYRRTD